MTTADIIELARRMLFHLDAGRSIHPGSIAHEEIRAVIYHLDAETPEGTGAEVRRNDTGGRESGDHDHRGDRR